MRILLKLESTRDQEYQLDYHYSVQGFIYNMLKGSRFEDIHDKDGYKFFCFSNIFPYSSIIKKGDKKHLFISSPSDDLIMYIAKRVREHKRSKDVISVGAMKFLINGLKIIRCTLNKSQFTFIAATPIIVRIPREKYTGLNPKHNYNYLYWRRDYPLELFIRQLEDNLYKKYKAYTGLDIENNVKEEIENTRNNYELGDGSNDSVITEVSNNNSPSGHIINKLMFIKQIAKEIHVHGNRHIIICTLWRFWFNLEQYNRCSAILKLLQFAMDVGFGERNSLGFGFMNIRKSYK
ncbi:MAG: CRISPR-associated endoribonuclease Cas6 [Candidatus Nitrosocaldaceae archaeon]